MTKQKTMTQKHFWELEYSDKSPSFEELASEKPNTAVIKLVDYLTERKVALKGKLLEVGCGMGRNTNWLARHGFEVTGVDISSNAISEAKKRAKKINLSVRYQQLDILKKWPFATQSFDFVIDIVTSQLLTEKQRKSYTSKIFRTLKPGGKFLLYTLDRSVDRQAQGLLRKYPGPEEYTYKIPQGGLIERTFTLKEIKKLYTPMQIESSELLFVPTKFKNKTYERYFWWVLFRKGL